MNRSKIFLSGLIFTLFSIGSVLAQTPDTTTFKYSASRRWHNVVITLRDKTTLTGYMHYYLPYAPEKTVYLIPAGGTKKNTEKIKRDRIESIDYADMRYELLEPDPGNEEYLARVVNKGKLELFVFTEFKSAPVPIPVAGLARVISIPYDQSIFFVRKGSNLVKIDRSLFREKLFPYVKDNTRIAEKLKTKEVKFKDIPNLIAEYNTEASNL
jgi:hypothetical protein